MSMIAIPTASNPKRLSHECNFPGAGLEYRFTASQSMTFINIDLSGLLPQNHLMLVPCFVLDMSFRVSALSRNALVANS